MSKDKQEESIPSQRRALLALAEKHGYTIISEYIDAGISGDNTERRADFQRMMADCAKGLFDCILCWDQDRFGRFDPLTAGYWIRPMREAGIILHTIAQGVIDWESFEGRIVWTVAQEGKHAYLRDMSRNCLRGVRDAVLAGKRVSRPPMGYRIDKETNVLVIHPEEAEFIRRIFREYIEGKSLRELTGGLRDSPIKPRKSKGWDSTTIRCMLMNRTYTGDTHWNVINRGRYHKVSAAGIVPVNGKGRASATEVITVPKTHPAIVSKADFALVQKKLELNRGHSGKNKTDFIFSGLVTCGHCESAMCGRTDSQQGGRYVYYLYTCIGNGKKGPEYCPRHAITQPELRSRVQKYLGDWLAGEGIENELRANMKQRAGTKAGDRRIALAEARLAELDSKLRDGRKRFFDLPESKQSLVLAHLDEMTKDRAEAEAEVERLRANRITPEEYGKRLAEAEALTERLASWLAGEDNTLFRKAVLAMVSRITLRFRRRKARRNSYCEVTHMDIDLRPATDFAHPA